MKVLHVINGLGTGGAERSLAELMPALAARGLESVVACLHRRTEGVEDTVISSGVHVCFVDATSLPGRVRALRGLIRHHRPDVVHTTIFEADVAARLASIATGVPVVTSLVNPSYGPERRRDPALSTWRLGAARVVDGFTARHLTSRFIAISEEVARAGVRDLGLRRTAVDVIPRARDLGRLGEPSVQRRRAAREALGIAPDRDVLLHVGRHEYQKGLDVLLEAMTSVRARRQVLLLQAGRRGSASAMVDREIERQRLGDDVRLLGHRDDVPDLLAAADVFVFPSRFEGLGGSLIEALAMGVPIVASDLPAVREVVTPGVSGDLVPADRPAELADAVVALLEDADRRIAYKVAGEQVFATRFSFEHLADRFAAVLVGVAQARRPRR